MLFLEDIRREYAKVRVVCAKVLVKLELNLSKFIKNVKVRVEGIGGDDEFGKKDEERCEFSQVGHEKIKSEWWDACEFELKAMGNAKKESRNSKFLIFRELGKKNGGQSQIV
jgi:hypothetical protein